MDHFERLSAASLGERPSGRKLDGRVKPAHGEKFVTLISSYHCSRYNTNTGVLTTRMFEDVVAKAKKLTQA